MYKYRYEVIQGPLNIYDGYSLPKVDQSPVGHPHLPGFVEQQEGHRCQNGPQQLPYQLCHKHSPRRSQGDVPSPEVAHECCCAACGPKDDTTDAKADNDAITLQGGSRVQSHGTVQ